MVLYFSSNWFSRSSLILTQEYTPAQGFSKIMTTSQAVIKTYSHSKRVECDELIGSRSEVAHRNKLPAWIVQDPFIIRGYRKQQDSYTGCFQSLWSIHNETVNIWSHLGSGILFSIVAAWTWSTFPTRRDGNEEAKRADLIAIQAYLLGATVCCFFSASYHCLNCHSERVAQCSLKLDYLGIAINITSTCISAAYFGIYDHPRIARAYMTAILACGVAVFYSLLGSGVDGPSAAKFRSIVFIALGTSGFAPILHAALSPALTLDGFSLKHVVAQSAFYLIGTTVYVKRIPEKHWAGTFDVWGASHQIFHILVNVAQIVHFFGLRRSLMQHYLRN
ncbi:hemolysin-III channel protein-like protein Izh2 [Xylariaceae sp. FL0255]|nr:hemolysin-III channel protein-like protein Izh2 [Xylariaceae sp. FL0255]